MNPTTIVIFGASGDLTERKLIPALFNLYRKGRLPDSFRVVGSSRTEYSHEAFREHLREGLHSFAPADFDPDRWEEFAPAIYYLPGSATEPAYHDELKKFIEEIESAPSDRLYYLATAPNFFPIIAHLLGAAGLNDVGEYARRLIVEKPFGHDLRSARELNQALQATFQEQQIYRIDHYLGKETAQNILFFRFANTLFELGWNRNYIDHVQISVLETVDVGHRAGYYDQAGVMRDMIQNHLLQLLALVAMEPPASFDADAIRNERVKLFSAIRPFTLESLRENTLRAQYIGYRDHPDTPPGSQTPTYAALRLFIDNWRWQGVPFYLRSGKALNEKASQISIQFHRPPHIMFPLSPGSEIEANKLDICIQPDEGIHLQFQVKVPDTVAEMRSVDMEFHYHDDFEESSIPDAYERLLLDALLGDASLFTRSDGIEHAWQLVDPIIEGWERGSVPLATYEPGSRGPVEADYFIARDNRMWLKGCREHRSKGGR